MTAAVPRLLLISELPLGYSRDGLHVNPILYNLFRDYPADRILQVTTDRALRQTPPAAPFDDRTLGLADEFVPTLRNRIGLRINSWLDRINRQLLDLLPAVALDRVRQFDPEVILLVPITPWTLVIGRKAIRQQNVPYAMYYMDNPASQDDQGVCLLPPMSAGSLVADLLAKAKGWLAISEPLIGQLAERYGVEASSTMLATNTIDLAELPPPVYDQRIVAGPSDSAYRIVYAGSIQPMHYDAIHHVAEAVNDLRAAGKSVELVLHTLPVFWQTYRQQWERFGVVDGGLVAYADLNRQLKNADLLLVATSFLPANEPVVRSSILTKTFDYMATGRPILSYGPIYSANNRFVALWQCGLVYDDSNVAALRLYLETQIAKTAPQRALAQRAYTVLQEHYDRTKVNLQLQAFLRRIAADGAEN